MMLAFNKRHLQRLKDKELIALISDVKPHKIQELLNVSFDAGLDVDGYLGNESIVAIAKYSEFLKATIPYLVNKRRTLKKPSLKQTAISHLTTWEGTKIHYIKGEKGYTTPLGVYSFKHPESEPVLYTNKLYFKYGLDTASRRDAKKLDKLINKKERDTIVEMAWEYYKRKYFKTEPVSLLAKDKPLTAVSLFSIMINGGRKRGIISLQRVLKITDDGIYGKNTRRTLISVGNTISDKKMNLMLLSKMADFYCYLAISHKKAKHYRRFLKGWFNRLRSLGYLKSTC